jgi:flavorubredoxin
MFCCDAFGAFKTLPIQAILETDIDIDKQNIYECSHKYFASVFYGHREWILKATEKFKKKNLEIKTLAPSHGPVLNQTPQETIDRWTTWSKGNYKKTVTIAYASMYGMTAKCLNAIADGVTQAGGTTKNFNLSETPPVDALTALVDAPALIIGVPTYEHELFPKVADFINLLKVKKFSKRHASVFGSFGWSGEATKKAAAELSSLGFEIVGEPLPIYGSPTNQELEKARQLGKALVEKAFAQPNVT